MSEKKFDFAKAPVESRRAFWDLVKRLAPKNQQRVSQLLWSVVFKNELPELIESLPAPPQALVAAEMHCDNLMTSWTKQFASAGMNVVSNRITTTRAGYYRIILTGMLRFRNNPATYYARAEVSLSQNGAEFWRPIFPGVREQVPDQLYVDYRFFMHTERIIPVTPPGDLRATLTIITTPLSTPVSYTVHLFRLTAVHLGDLASA